jgi:excinuclease ABC subunit A
VGACYVLDEPSIGLHSRDTARLIRILAELRDLGNTIIVVEHDPDVMRAADHIIDLGPGAGELGGSIVFEGDFPALIADRNGSLTGRYLRGEMRVSRRKHRREPNPKKMLRFFGARMHNLKGVDVAIPLGLLTVVTGVSGSGKSTLVHDVIYRRCRRGCAHGARRPIAAMTAKRDGDESPRMTCTRMEGADAVQEVVMIDQTPIGRTPRSNPVTYIKASISSAACSRPRRDGEKRGYTAGHFSFNVPGGRCETCQGDGTVTVEMQFLADVELVCDECKGTRFKSAILDIKYKGLNIHEVLQLTVREAIGSSTTRRAGDAPEAARRSRPGLSAAGAIGHHAFGRRSPARQTGRASRAVDQQGTLVYLRRAHHRAALRRHQEAAGGVSNG